MESTNQEETINELKAALAELESDEGLEMFVEGHGLQSRSFAFSWQSDELEIDYNLPYARVLSDEEEQKLDAARIGAAIRLAILLLATSSSGALLHDGETTLFVTADEAGASYSIVGTDETSRLSGLETVFLMDIKLLQYGTIARMKEILLPPALRGAGMRGFVVSRESKAPGIQAMAKAF